MAETNATDTGPGEDTQQQREADVPAVNDMSDFENGKDNSILTNGTIAGDEDTQTSDDDENPGALTEDEGRIENDFLFEREPVDEDQMEDDATSSVSHYSESLADDEEAIQTFKQKIIALGTELHVDFEDIEYIREDDRIRAFPLTMRNPPEGATWPDGTRAVLRLNGWFDLNDDSSHGSDSEDDPELSSDEAVSSEASDNTEEAAILDSASSDQINSSQATEGGNETVFSIQEVQAENEEDANEPQSPVSTTSNSSVSSNLSGSTLLNDYYDSDSGSYDSDDEEEEDDQWERLDEALLSNLLGDHGVPAPKILAFDISWHNALKRPYSIQTYPPGNQVSKIHREKKEMSFEDRLWLAGEAAELRARLDTIRFQGTGRLLAPVDESVSAGRLPLRMSVTADVSEKLETCSFLIDPIHPESNRFSPCGRLYYSLYDAMFWSVEDLMATATVKYQVNFEGPFRAYAAIKDMLRDMDHLGWFSEADRAYSESVLNHGSIDDSQIVVEQNEDTSKPWRLAGIIGLDEADTVPSVLNRKPWNFLWDVYDASELLPKETGFSWNGDVDELPTELPYLNSEDLRIKQHHEDVLIEKLYTPQYGDKAREKYFDDTYGRGRWLRRLFGFAREGVSSPGDLHRFNRLLRDWNHFKESQNIETRPLNLWEGLPDYIHGNDRLFPQLVKPPPPPQTASSSLQHVYFFIDPPQSPSRGEAAATEVPDTSDETEAISSNSSSSVYVESTVSSSTIESVVHETQDNEEQPV